MERSGDHKENRTTMGSSGIPLPGEFIEVKDGTYIPESILEEVKSDLERLPGPCVMEIVYLQRAKISDLY